MEKTFLWHGHTITIKVEQIPDTVNCILYGWKVYDNDELIMDYKESGLYYVYPEIAMIKAEIEFENYSSDAFTS